MFSLRRFLKLLAVLCRVSVSHGCPISTAESHSQWLTPAAVDAFTLTGEQTAVTAGIPVSVRTVAARAGSLGCKLSAVLAGRMGSWLQGRTGRSGGRRRSSADLCAEDADNAGH